MSAKDDAIVARRAFEALLAHDWDTLNQTLAEDVSWNIAGESPLAGEHRGPTAVARCFQQAEAIAEGNLRIELHDVLASDEHVVILANPRARRAAGKTLDNNEIYTIQVEQGRVTLVWLCAYDQRAWDAFFS